MKRQTFEALLQSGHQEDACEVPFDPAKTWGIAPIRLWRGRRGHPVLATVNGVSFETFIVPRQHRFFMLIDEDMKLEAGVTVGEVLGVTISPVPFRQNS